MPSPPLRTQRGPGTPMHRCKTPSANIPTSARNRKTPKRGGPDLARNRKTPKRKGPDLRVQPKNPCARLPETRHAEVRRTTREGFRVARNRFTVARNAFPVAHGGREVRSARVLPLRSEVSRPSASVFRLRTGLLPLRARVFGRSAGVDFARVASAGAQMQLMASAPGARRFARGHPGYAGRSAVPAAAPPVRHASLREWARWPCPQTHGSRTTTFGQSLSDFHKKKAAIAV